MNEQAITQTEDEVLEVRAEFTDELSDEALDRPQAQWSCDSAWSHGAMR